MKRNKLLNNCLIALCLFVGQAVYAEGNLLPADNLNSQTEKINLEQKIQINPTTEDLLRKQKLTVQDPKADLIDKRFSKEYLLANPRDLEKLFALNLATGKKDYLEQLAQLYRQVEDRDESLIEWSEAALLASTDLNRSIRAYRVLAAKFPENDFIRFQMATILFYNQEFDAAKEQFEKLRSSANVSKDDIAVFDQFLEQIASKNKWNFTFGAQYLNDNNITESADVGTTMVLPNGHTLTQTNPKETGRGINYNVGVNKQWSLNQGKYIQLDSEINHKYYWDNKKFNELVAYVGTGFGYADARLNLQVTPYVTKRWYAGGASSQSNKLKSYTQSAGASLMGSYWLTPSVKYTANYNVNYEKYRNSDLAERYNSTSQTVGNTVMWLTSPKQYWGGGVDFTHRNAKDDVVSYNRPNVRVFWGQEWPKGFATRVNASIAKRNYREANFLGKQKNTEYRTSVSVWHKAVHFKGFTPRLTFSYEKTKSNIPLYSFKKKQAFIEVDKTF